MEEKTKKDNKHNQMKETITITINKKLWKKLSQLELDKDFKTHDEAIEYLLKLNNGKE